MRKKNIEAIKKMSLYGLIICAVLSACKKTENNNVNTYNLNCSYYSQLIQKPISLKIKDSLNFINLYFDYKRDGKNVKRVRTFKLMDNAYYELKLNKHFEDSNVDSIYTKAFSLSDTSYTYVFDEDKYPLNLPRGFDDWKYTTKKIAIDSYSLIKRHLTDSTFKEEYYYDGNFTLKKINIYQGNDTLMFVKK